MTKKVGFVGIGNMGWGMASNLAKAKLDLWVFDTDVNRVDKFAAEFGCKGTVDLKNLSDCDVIVTMLPTGAIVRDVLVGGNDGASFASSLKKGSIVVDMSSSEPLGTQELGDELSNYGVILLDAPVSGGVVKATSGELAIMIGADDEMALESVMPLIEIMGAKIFKTGALGSGHAMKAVNNYVAAATFAASSEALAIGAKFGLDLETVVDILNVSTGKNFHTDLILKQHVLSGKYASGFQVALLAKDVKIAADLSKSLCEQTPLLDLMQTRWFEARDMQGPTADYTTAHLAWTKASEQ